MSALLDGLWMSTRDSWEQSRLQAYVTVKANAKRGSVGSITSFLKFPWDDKESVTDTAPITEEDKKRLKARAEEFKKYIKE